ncbi:hypothetical protein K449DRAFT_436713 [Hypoxylon sp. EC38]|nr:hypothetical protein K449DRAFT_436713 [Hypoxylon sp. EC38]
MPTKRIYIFDGTWANRNSTRKPTILNAILEILSVSGAQQQIRYFPGVGTRYGIVEKYVGGGFGYGLEEDILEAVDDLAINYSPNDEIIVVGYSRGAYIARCFVSFLDRLGLPQSDRENIHQLYGKYISGNLLQRGVAERLFVKYNCRRITIKCLICIDTVGALGIPRTGVLGLFSIFSPIMKKREFMETDVASNVEKIFHALALHEFRGPFQPTLMHVPREEQTRLKQVYFLGNHSDVGMLSEAGSLCDIVLAAVLQQLLDIGVIFNQEKIPIWFPHAGADRPFSEAGSHDWVHDPIHRSATGLWGLLGRHVRKPGQYLVEGTVVNETIHASVRLRGYGLEKSQQVIAGYSVEAESAQKYFWHRDRQNGTSPDSNDSTDSLRIDEEPLGEYEAWLHGIALK